MPAGQTLNIGLYVDNRAAVFLEDYPLSKMVDTAVMAEELGYHSLWVGNSMQQSQETSHVALLS